MPWLFFKPIKIFSCGGSLASGGQISGCTTAAGSAAATSALNSLLKIDPNTMTEAQKQNYSNLIQTLVTGVTLGSSAPAAQMASQIELDNNALSLRDSSRLSALKSRLSALQKEDRFLVATNADLAAVQQEIAWQRYKTQYEINELNAKDKAQSFWVAHQAEFIAIRDTAVDFTPVIGDIKAFVEARTTADYMFAVAGIVPGIGDSMAAANKAYKIAEKAQDLNAAKNALRTAADIIRNNFINGGVFEKSALEHYGYPKNSIKTTVTARGETYNIIPDAIVAGRAGTNTFVEIKNALYITGSKQFRGYAHLSDNNQNKIILVVSPRTKAISQTIVNMIERSGGRIEVYNPISKTTYEWRK